MREFLLYGFATWRIASLLVNEAGFGGLFQHLREFAGIEHDEQGNKTIIPDGFLPGLLSCVWCASVWIGAGWTALDWILPGVAPKLAMPFAFSAVAVLIELWVKGRTA